MDDATFDRLVSEDVKNLLPQEKSDYLRLPENLNRWKDSLLELIENLDEQIAELTQDEKMVINSKFIRFIRFTRFSLKITTF